ncbi:MAG TPA: DUF1493 family protein [Rhizomicrobium sp.]|nr:DUF1493 family protein [Rhizomicrobium sp.]
MRQYALPFPIPPVFIEAVSCRIVRRMEGRDKIRREIEALLAQAACRKAPFAEDTRILQDLNIGGDDADEFLEAIHEKFGTRFDGFEFTAYFPNEHEALGEYWVRRLGFQDTRKPVTMGHLTDVIQRGSWFEPPGQPSAFVPNGNLVRRYAVRGMVAIGMPICYSLAAVAVGAYGFGLSPGSSLLLFGFPAAAVLGVIMWRRLPAN